MRSTFFLCFTVVILTFLYNAPAVMWWGGFSIGPRHLVPALPFLAFPMIFSFHRLMPKTWGRIVIVVLIALSCANVWIQTLATDRLVPDIIVSGDDTDMDSAEWTLYHYQQGNIVSNLLFDWSIPKLMDGDITNTVGSYVFGVENLATTLIPLFVIWGIILLFFRVFATDTGQP